MTVATREAPTDPDLVRRRELAAFLRSRRERITPGQVGLPPAGRRRTPGLRREEVAQLAGVGITWYTWLEQGRDIRASEQVLAAIAGTLRLDPHERAHLYTLAGAEPPVQADCQTLQPQVHTMMAKLEPYPVMVRNARTDILAYNRAYDWLMGGLDDVAFEDRDSLLLLLTLPSVRERIVDLEDNLAKMVAEFRAAMADHIAEPSWKCLLKQLRESSEEFNTLWEQHEVRPPRNITKRFLHPEAGLLCFDYTNLWFGPRSEKRLTTYTPADEATERKLPSL